MRCMRTYTYQIRTGCGCCVDLGLVVTTSIIKTGNLLPMLALTCLGRGWRCTVFRLPFFFFNIDCTASNIIE